MSLRRQVLPIPYGRRTKNDNLDILNTKIIKLESTVNQKNRAIDVLATDVGIFELDPDELEEQQDIIDADPTQISVKIPVEIPPPNLTVNEDVDEAMSEVCPIEMTKPLSSSDSQIDALAVDRFPFRSDVRCFFFESLS